MKKDLLTQAREQAKAELARQERALQEESYRNFLLSQKGFKYEELDEKTQDLIDELVQTVVKADAQAQETSEVDFEFKLYEHGARSTDNTSRGYLMPELTKADGEKVLLPGYDVRWLKNDVKEGNLRAIYITRNDEVSGFQRARAYFAYKNGDENALETRAKKELGNGFWNEETKSSIPTEELDERRLEVLENKKQMLIRHCEKNLAPEQTFNYEGAAICVVPAGSKVQMLKQRHNILGARSMPRGVIDRSDILSDGKVTVSEQSEPTVDAPPVVVATDDDEIPL